MGPEGTIEAMQFTGDGTEVLAVGGSTVAVGWVWDTGKESHRDGPKQSSATALAVGSQHEAFVAWVETSGTATITNWPPPGSLREAPFSTLPLPVSFACLAYSPSRRLLAAGNRGVVGDIPWDQRSAVRVWDTQTTHERAVLLGHTDCTLALAFTSDGKELVSAGKDGTVRFWNLSDFAP